MARPQNPSPLSQDDSPTNDLGNDTDASTNRHAADNGTDASPQQVQQSRLPGQPPISTPSPHPTSPTSEEGYPSWLPKRPPPPAPTSTFQSSVNMYAAEVAPAAENPLSGRKPTPRSVRIVSLQDSDRRENTDQSRTRVPSASAPAHPRVWSRTTGAAMSPTVISALDARLRPALPRFRASGLHLELLRNPSPFSRLYFYLLPLFVFAHIPLQTFFDFNAVFVMIEIAKFPNPVAPGVPGSGRGWSLGAAAYVACWVVWIFGVFIAYELVYSFYRRWRFKRPAIMPLYLSSSAFNFVSMTSYSNFCFMHHVRVSAFPRFNPSAVLPSNDTSLRDALAETCYFYSQNLPTVVALLPRAGLVLALLLSYWSPEQLPGGLTFTDIDQSVGRRDGALSGSATGRYMRAE